MSTRYGFTVSPMKHAPVIPILENRQVGRWFVHGLVPFLLGAAWWRDGDVILAATLRESNVAMENHQFIVFVSPF